MLAIVPHLYDCPVGQGSFVNYQQILLDPEDEEK